MKKNNLKRFKMTNKKPISIEAAAQVIGLLAEGNTLRYTAEKVGISVATVNRIKQDNHRFLNPRRRPGPVGLSDELKQQVVAARKAGMKRNEIGKKFGISEGTVQNILKSAKLTENHSPTLSQIQKARKMRAQGMSYDKIGEALGFSHPTVKKYTKDVSTKKKTVVAKQPVVEQPVVAKPKPVAKQVNQPCLKTTEVSLLWGAISIKRMR